MENVESKDLPFERASPEVDAKMRKSVENLGQALLRKYQMNGGQFNPIDLELKVMMLIEQIQMLSIILLEMSGGKHTDESTTLNMIERIEALIKSMAPPSRLVVAQAVGRAMNGSKHG